MAGRRRPGPAGSLVFRADSGDLFTLNGTAAVVWRWYAAGHPVETIARRLSRRYRIVRAEARRDVYAFLGEVRRQGLEIRG